MKVRELIRRGGGLGRGLREEAAPGRSLQVSWLAALPWGPWPEGRI